MNFQVTRRSTAIRFFMGNEKNYPNAFISHVHQFMTSLGQDVGNIIVKLHNDGHIDLPEPFFDFKLHSVSVERSCDYGVRICYRPKHECKQQLEVVLRPMGGTVTRKFLATAFKITQIHDEECTIGGYDVQNWYVVSAGSDLNAGNETPLIEAFKPVLHQRHLIKELLDEIKVFNKWSS